MEKIFGKIWPTAVYPVVVFPAAIAGVIGAISSEIICEALNLDYSNFLFPGTGEVEFFILSSLVAVIGFWGVNALIEAEWKRPFCLIDHFRICFFLYVIVLFTSNRLIVATDEYRHLLFLGATFVPAWWGIFVNLIYMMYQGFRKKT